MRNAKTKEERYLEMLNQNKALVYKVASIYADNQEDKKDLIQDIYFQLWKSLDSFSEKSKISTWMYRICLNTSIQYLKRKSRKVNHEDFKKNHIERQGIQDNSLSEAIQNMLQSIQKLNELDKGIILLYLDEKSHKEIAEIIGITVSNVATRIQRIKTKLNKLNKEHF